MNNVSIVICRITVHVEDLNNWKNLLNVAFKLINFYTVTRDYSAITDLFQVDNRL